MPPARRAGTPPGQAHRRRAELAAPGRRGRLCRVHRPQHHVPRTQATTADNPDRGRAHRGRCRPRRGAADHLAGRGEHRAEHGHDQEGRPPQGHRRGHRRPGPSPRGQLRRHDHRADPLPATPPYRHGLDLHQEPASRACGCLEGSPPPTKHRRSLSVPTSRMSGWSPSRTPNVSWALGRSPSIGGSPTAS